MAGERFEPTTLLSPVKPAVIWEARWVSWQSILTTVGRAVSSWARQSAA